MKDLVKMRVRVPKGLLTGIDFLIEAGLYPNRNEAIRAAIVDALKELNLWK